MVTLNTCLSRKFTSNAINDIDRVRIDCDRCKFGMDLVWITPKPSLTNFYIVLFFIDFFKTMPKKYYVFSTYYVTMRYLNPKVNLPKDKSLISFSYLIGQPGIGDVVVF